MARWISIAKPFNYHWPDRSAVTHFADIGDHFVKDEVADFAVERGYASEGKADASSRSRKGKKAKRRTKEAPAAKAADTGTAAPMGNQNAAGADRSADRPAVDHDAG